VGIAVCETMGPARCQRESTRAGPRWPTGAWRKKQTPTSPRANSVSMSKGYKRNFFRKKNGIVKPRKMAEKGEPVTGCGELKKKSVPMNARGGKRTKKNLR